jgi:prephenate dehydratase
MSTAKSKSRPAAAPARPKAAADRICYQGEPGANSHIACQEKFPKFEPVPCPTFEDALAAVRNGDVRYGMIPIENTIAGRVADIHHLIPNSGLYIVGEHFLPIRFQLMGLKSATLAGIKDVYSHVHGIGQCRKFMAEHGMRPHIAGDTAGSAREVAEWGDPTKGALAPKLAAEIYGLKILAENVEDAAHNTTRFVILAREPEDAKPGSGPTLTTLIFRVKNVPAALYKALGGFATNGVNMTKLESYMSDGSFTATTFYADIDGHPADANAARALEELQFFSTELRILGVYPASPFRPIVSEGGRGFVRR